MDELTHLDLFSGIGGFALAAQREGFRTIAFCEIENYAQRVLIKNFGAVMADSPLRGLGTDGSAPRQSGHADECGEALPVANAIGRNGRAHDERQAAPERDWPAPRIYSDITKLDGTQFRGVTLLTGGFPCQPFSVAGKRRGASDHRALWPEMLRVIAQARPAWVLGENVAGIINMELDRVLSDLEAIGYSTRPFVIPACAVDARHRRDRVWIVGKSDSAGRESREQTGQTLGHGNTVIPAGCNGANPGCALLQRRVGESAEVPTQWKPEPNVGRVAHGIPKRVDRLKGLGNAIVSQVAQEIIYAIKHTHEKRNHPNPNIPHSR